VRRDLHDKAGYMTASVPIRVLCKRPLTSRVGPYMTMPLEDLEWHALSWDLSAQVEGSTINMVRGLT
jgi:hypothetical protein